MALSKNWTLADLESSLRVLAKEIHVEDIQSESIRKYINLALLDVARMLNGASAPDYHTELVVTTGEALGTPVQATSFTHSTKTIVKTAHGLTSADIGKSILLFETDGTGLAFALTLGYIVSITNSTSFVVSVSPGTNLPNLGSYVYYKVLTTYSQTYIDLSSLNIDRIIKLVDATNGLVVRQGDLDIEGVSSLNDNKNGVFYNHAGEKIVLKKGSNVSAYGVLTLHYYRLPALLSTSTDYIDIKDNYVPLVMAHAKNYIYEHANKQAPESLTNLIMQRTAEAKKSALEEMAIIKGREK